MDGDSHPFAISHTEVSAQITADKNENELGTESQKLSLREREIEEMMKARPTSSVSRRQAWTGQDFPVHSVSRAVAGSGLGGPRRIPWLVELKAFCYDASVVGLRYVVNSSASVFRRSVWVLLLLAGVGFTTFQIQDRIRHYLAYPKSVNIRVDYAEEMRFPTVTICNENRAMLSKVAQLDQVSTIISLFPPFPIPDFQADFTGYTLDQMDIDWYDLYEFMAQSPEEALLMCQFSGAWCTPESHFRPTPTNMGFCFSFNPASMNHTIRQPGSTNGLQINLHVDQKEYLYSSSMAAGFRMLLHDPEEKPLMLERGFVVSPGVVTQVSVNARYMVDLPSPYGDCEPSDNYTQSNCLAECEADYIINNCSCKDVAMPGDVPLCDPKTYYQCYLVRYLEYIQNNEAANCNCPRQCRQLNYDYSISQALMSNSVVNFAQNAFQLNQTIDEIKTDYCVIQVFFSELKYTYVEATAAYSVLDLLCDIGGALGLILGSTLLTVCEFTDLLFTLTAAWVKVRVSADVVSTAH